MPPTLKFASLHVENFRSLKSIDIPLSDLSCLVGHNNSGKSSVMIALSILLTGEKLQPSDFFDTTRDVIIGVSVTGFTDDALNRIHEDFRERIAAILIDGRLELVRRYTPDGKSRLNCKTMAPKDDSLSLGALAEALRGTKGAAIAEAASSTCPTLADSFKGCTTQTAAKEVLEKHIASLPPDDLTPRESPLPTGIDNSVIPLLPEPIYIPAVQDMSDALKTKEAASFGKLLKVFAEIIEHTEPMKKISASFDLLNKLLNRQRDDNEIVTDERLAEVKEIESTVETFLQDQFANARLEIEIPPPELKTVFGNAKIFVNDGVRTEADHKGDGLKRALTFALLRSYVELRRKQKEMEHNDMGNVEAPPRQYLFLFEEPELYLHPQGQRILYDCLVAIADEHQVIASTHSPYFLNPSSTGTFVRLHKSEIVAGDPAPATATTPLMILENLDKRDAFQLLCYENNAAAFFADSVVLVEGDSDQIFLGHIAPLLTKHTLDSRNIALVQTGGKGNIARYRAFFEEFGVAVHVVTDLDALVKDFDKLGASPACGELKSNLIQVTDEAIKELEIVAELSGRDIRRMVTERTWREKLARAKEICEKAKGEGCTDAEAEELEDLFAKSTEATRLFALRTVINLAKPKHELLDALRKERIYILSSGAIEDYLPEAAEGPDKPSVALAACKLVASKEAAELCGGHVDCNGQPEHELTAILAHIVAST